MLKYLTLITLAGKYAFPIALAIYRAASDGKVTIAEAHESLDAIWPRNEEGRHRVYKLPFYVPKQS
jgi:hypothetical protein